MIMGKGMHWMSKTLGRNLLLARLKQAGRAGRGEAAAARGEGRGIWQGGEGEEKEDSTLAATHLWLLGSSTWPIYKREELYCAAQINYDAEV